MCVRGGWGGWEWDIMLIILKMRVVIMMKVIVMAMLHSVVVCEVGYNANHIEDEGSNNDDGDSDGYASLCY